MNPNYRLEALSVLWERDCPMGKRFGCTAPLPKEVRAHIAVAMAFLWEE